MLVVGTISLVSTSTYPWMLSPIDRSGEGSFSTPLLTITKGRHHNSDVWITFRTISGSRVSLYHRTTILSVDHTDSLIRVSYICMRLKHVRLHRLLKIRGLFYPVILLNPPSHRVFSHPDSPVPSVPRVSVMTPGVVPGNCGHWLWSRLTSLW